MWQHSSFLHFLLIFPYGAFIPYFVSPQVPEADQTITEAHWPRLVMALATHLMVALNAVAVVGVEDAMDYLALPPKRRHSRRSRHMLAEALDEALDEVLLVEDAGGSHSTHSTHSTDLAVTVSYTVKATEGGAAEVEAAMRRLPEEILALTQHVKAQAGPLGLVQEVSVEAMQDLRVTTVTTAPGTGGTGGEVSGDGPGDGDGDGGGGGAGGAVAGGVIGCLLGALLAGGGYVMYRRRMMRGGSANRANPSIQS